ncbi:hypothetical protein Q1695_009763 [Nippostrongylus brasiliensis]|nr:hypothetical protein Q1695_009763 [Nippostrongylus brasiliensis]
MTAQTTPIEQEVTPPSRIGFCYEWNTKISMRAVSDEESVILIVSPKFATVHDHVSFQWTLKIHGTTGRLNESDDEMEEEFDSPSDYVAVELYFVDGPISQVDVRAVVRVMQKDAKNESNPEIVEERKTISMQRGQGVEVTGKDRTPISQFLQENVGRIVKVSVMIKMDAKLFDPYTYLDKVSPTPHKSFLTTNYNARVNSKIWRRRSRKKSVRDENGKMSRKDTVDFEKKFAEVMEQERGRLSEANRLRVGDPPSRRGSIQTIHSHQQEPDHEHLFKKLLISCCESCERRRNSFLYESRTEDESDDMEDADSSEDEEEKCFECRDSNKEHVHDLLANMYFNKIVLPGMEYVEDFVDFLIDAELNDLPVLKRACERYLCGELNTKKDLLTSLLLDLLFISIVFQLPVMKSMTLSELSNRTEELSQPDKLMEDEEYKVLDKRVRSLSDRNLVELIEQCVAFAEQRNRVQVVALNP